MLRLVLDTNTLISAFFWEGHEADLFRKIEQGKADLFISEDILKEIEDVIHRPKFEETMIKVNITPDQVIQKIISISHLVIGERLNISICRDIKDNMLLECAINSKANYLVSGDEDLLSLKRYESVNIVRTKDILNLI